MSDEPKVDPDAWMGTLSDLVFLLITFFVLLISSSSMDAKKLKSAFGFFDGAWSILNFSEQSGGSNSLVSSSNPLNEFLASKQAHLLSLDEDALALLDQRKAIKPKNAMPGVPGGYLDGSLLGTLNSLAKRTGGEMRVEAVDKGLEVMLTGRLLFPDGSLELNDEAQALISDISTIIKLWGGKVDVVAHWSWREGPSILGQIADSLERNWIKGQMINPVLYPVAKRTVRFVLLKED